MVRRGAVKRQAGFTLIELLIAMALFSFMLLIVVSGIMNIIRIRNETLASNATQDSARTAMNEIVRAVRDSSSVENVTGGPNGNLCLIKAGGSIAYYYVNAGVLRRGDNCAGGGTSVPLTNTSVNVTNFDPAREVSGPTVKKEELKITLTLASNNGTADATGVCTGTYKDKQFCSAITLTSGAVAR